MRVYDPTRSASGRTSLGITKDLRRPARRLFTAQQDESSGPASVSPFPAPFPGAHERAANPVLPERPIIAPAKRVTPPLILDQRKMPSSSRLANKAQARAIPGDQLNSVRALVAEQINRPENGSAVIVSRTKLPPRLCESRKVWSPPSPGPRRSSRSRAGLSTHAAPSSKSLRPRSGRPGSSRLDLDRSSSGLDVATRQSPRGNSRRLPAE